MKKAERDAAKKVHKYQRVKQSLVTNEAKEMQSKQVEAEKLRGLKKAKEIEKKQEENLKLARKTAAKETRNALFMAFGKGKGAPLQKELSAALDQEKAQAKEIASLQSMESHGFSHTQAPAAGGQCESAANAATAYMQCYNGCVNEPAFKLSGKVDSCACWKCR